MPIRLPPDILTGAGGILAALLAARKRAKDDDARAPEGNLADAENGDVIKVDRGLYDHYGVYVARGRRVIHYTGAAGPADFNGVVRETSLEEFLNGARDFTVCRFPRSLEDLDQLARPSKLRISLPGAQGRAPMPEGSPLWDLWRAWKKLRIRDYRLYSGEETVRRARGELGKGGYNLLCNNCEHFAIWCKTGLKESSQVNQAVDILLALSAGTRRSVIVE